MTSATIKLRYGDTIGVRYNVYRAEDNGLDQLIGAIYYRGGKFYPVIIEPGVMSLKRPAEEWQYSKVIPAIAHIVQRKPLRKLGAKRVDPSASGMALSSGNSWPPRIDSGTRTAPVRGDYWSPREAA